MSVDVNLDGEVTYVDLDIMKKHKPGDFVKVYVNDAFDYDLSGEEIK